MSPQAETLDQAIALTPGREIVIKRTLDAPRELVFAVWTDPKHLPNWYGPNGFTTTIHEMDLKPGGVWRLTMHGPDGRDYHNTIVFSEVVRPERLVYRHVAEPGTEPVTHQTTVTFAARGGKTDLTLRMVFDSTAVRDHVIRTYHAVEGGKQTVGRLADYLATLRRSGDERRGVALAETVSRAVTAAQRRSDHPTGAGTTAMVQARLPPARPPRQDCVPISVPPWR
jgi:uncharacterized protein YndB with AHSA1/START domain